ncbi:general stress protein [Alteribacter natronophilus]|uniref:general stress protein n=1 Tax=Alteribacter natronophilus TaxID=2583810 RepID=UPI001485F99F|nr:general stress protein [Alteribacter natronophilus]
MRVEVKGVYETAEEAIRAIEKLRREGKTAEQVTIASKKELALGKVARETDAHVQDLDELEDPDRDDGFFDKVKNVLGGASGPDSDGQKLEDLGLNEEDASRFEEDVQNGNILVIVKDMGTVPNAAATDDTRDPRTGG